MKWLTSMFAGKPRGADDGAGPTVEQILDDYDRVLEEEREAVRDVADLPHDKAQIKQAILAALTLSTDEEERARLESNYLSLGEFQDVRDCDAQGVPPSDRRAQESKRLLAELRSRH